MDLEQKRCCMRKPLLSTCRLLDLHVNGKPGGGCRVFFALTSSKSSHAAISQELIKLVLCNFAELQL